MSTANALDAAFQRLGIKSSATQKGRQTGALVMDDPSKCPYCGGQMSIAIAHGHEVYLCSHDRHVVPTPDEN